MHIKKKKSTVLPNGSTEIKANNNKLTIHGVAYLTFFLMKKSKSLLLLDQKVPNI